jgi:predicted RNase H-like HicB family nuclease
MERHYAVIFEKVETGWGATVPELSCIASGETLEETQRLIREAVQAAIEYRIELGLELPEEASAAFRAQVASVRVGDSVRVSLSAA